MAIYRMDVTGAGSQQLQWTAPALPQSSPLHHSHSCSWREREEEGKHISNWPVVISLPENMRRETKVIVIILSLWFLRLDYGDQLPDRM